MVTIMKRPYCNPKGITVRELKEILSKLPNTSEDGEPYEIWIGNEGGTSNVLTLVVSLNIKKDGCDVLLETTQIGEK